MSEVAPIARRADRARRRGPAMPTLLQIEGGRELLSPLLAHHYRGDGPATVVRTLALVERAVSSPVACLAVSMPTLNAAWRSVAWPGVFESNDQAERAHVVNVGLRCISRVIVDPRYRGLGLASRLVRAYLTDPITPMTEAVASMGRVCPFFVRAGMAEHRLERRPHESRWLDALAEARVPAWRSCDARAVLGAVTRHPWLERELIRRLRACPTTRRAVNGTLGGMIGAACANVALAPTAYSHTVRGLEETDG